MDKYIEAFLKTQADISGHLARIAEALESQQAWNSTATPTAPVAPAAAAAAVEKKPEPKAVEKAPEPKSEEPAGPTLLVVRAALKEYRAIEGAPAMLEILKVHGGGVQELTAVKEVFYPAIMKAIAE